MAKVSLKNVSKLFRGDKAGEIAALRDVSLDIADHEFVVLVGPSGSGKSTLLRMVAGLEEISSGDILIGDRRVNDVPPKDRDVAMVFEDYALYPHMSVYDNMGFGLKQRKFAKTEIKKRVDDAAEILGIKELLDRKPKALSGAQRQRVAVGRAIVRQPKVFLFDEPLSNLDGRTRVDVRTEITKLHQRLEATMVYVTQDPLEAMTMGDRIVVMDRGVVQQDDAPLTVYNEPANLFVAGFLGGPPMNLIHGTLKQERETLVFREIGDGTVEARWPVSDRPAAGEFVGKPVVLGVRPEDLEVVEVTESKSAAISSFPAIVDVVEPTGAETVLYLHTGAHTIVCRSQNALDRREAGRRMRFAIHVKKAHLFDTTSTKRVR